MDLDKEKRVLARFKSETGDVTGNLLDLPLYVTVEHLTLICNSLLQQVSMMICSLLIQVYLLSMNCLNRQNHATASVSYPECDRPID